RKLSRWGSTSLPSVSMGQEVSVTTLQLAQAASVIANGGLLVKPRLILKKGSENVPAPTPVRVLKPDTAITMRQMMEGVVLVGTGQPNILEDGDGDDEPAPPANTPTVPNFRGMTMRAVLAQAAAKGLTVLPDGSGVARVQHPPAGSPLRQGERIRVQFAR